MYKVSRCKFIGELHRTFGKVSWKECHTLNAAESQSFLNLPKKVSITNANFGPESGMYSRRIQSEVSAVLKLLSRSFGVPQYEIVKSLVHCQKPSKDSQPSSANKKKDDAPHPSFRPDGKHDPPDEDKDPEKEKMMAVLSKAVFTMFLIFMVC